jgi:ABC-type oligopeptide transport system ATPase subunit
LLQAIDLKKYYPVKKGLFAPERLVKALDGVSFTLERGKRWRWSASPAAENRRWAVC